MPITKLSSLAASFPTAEVDFEDMIGWPYRARGRTSAAIDCIGVVLEIFRRAGLGLPDPDASPGGALERQGPLGPPGGHGHDRGGLDRGGKPLTVPQRLEEAHALRERGGGSRDIPLGGLDESKLPEREGDPPLVPELPVHRERRLVARSGPGDVPARDRHLSQAVQRVRFHGPVSELAVERQRFAVASLGLGLVAARFRHDGEIVQGQRNAAVVSDLAPDDQALVVE